MRTLSAWRRFHARPLPAAARAVALRLVLAALPLAGARAADLQGVTMPETMRVDGRELHLNGMGLRSYSILGIPIYVAGLYVEAPTHDPGAVVAPRGGKALVFHFVRDVDVGHVRDAWREGFDDNCPHPCAVPAPTVERFLASLVGVHSGDVSVLSFDGPHMAATLNGRAVGSFDDAALAGLLLASFFGPKPPSERLKRQLLGLG